jgi:hypothetical protein
VVRYHPGGADCASGLAGPAERKYRVLKTEEMLEMLEAVRSDIRSVYLDGECSV